MFGSFSLALKLNNKIHADKLPHNTFHSPYKTYINISCWNPYNGLIVLFGDIFHWLDKVKVLSSLTDSRKGGSQDIFSPLKDKFFESQVFLPLYCLPIILVVKLYRFCSISFRQMLVWSFSKKANINFVRSNQVKMAGNRK